MFRSSSNSPDPVFCNQLLFFPLIEKRVQARSRKKVARGICSLLATNYDEVGTGVVCDDEVGDK